MSFTDTYLTYRKHLGDVERFRTAKQREEIARRAAFVDKKLTPEELNLAKKRGDLLKRTIDSLDEYSQTRTEDVESVTQTVLGESTTFLTAIGVGLGNLYQATDSGKRLKVGIAKKMGRLRAAAPSVIPGVTGLVFAMLSSIPLLHSLTTIEVQTPRLSRFEGLKGELSNPNDYALLTDEQIYQAKKDAKKLVIPQNKPTDKSLLSSLNIFGQLKSYMGIVTKRAIYRKEKDDYEKRKEHSYSLKNQEKFTQSELEQAEETREIVQRLVNKVGLDSQDYTARVFAVLDVISMCLFGFGVVGYWAVEKAIDLLKIKQGKLKSTIPWATSIAAIIMLNTKVAEYRNNAIRIARHKNMNELMADPTNFLKTPKQIIPKKIENIEKPKKQNIFSFMKQFYIDLNNYEEYAKVNMLEDKKFKLAARKIKLTPEQLKQARLTQSNIFKVVNKVDDNKRKYEERFDVFTMMLSTPMGLVAAAMGNAFGWSLHKLQGAPKSKMPLYSILGTVVGLVPAIFVEVYTTLAVRKASRVAYMKAQEDLNDKKYFLDYTETNINHNPFLKMSFKNASNAFSQFKTF